MAEAILNDELGGCLNAYSSGVKASGTVNPDAKRLLQQKGIWQERYHSKTIETVLDEPFDLVVTVCDHAKETCPMFPKAVKTIHVGFEDPTGKEFDEYEKTYELIKRTLVPIIKKELCDAEKSE